LTEWYEKYPPSEAGSKKRVSLLEEAEPRDVLKDAAVAMEAESTAAKKRFSCKLKSQARRPLLRAPGRNPAGAGPRRINQISKDKTSILVYILDADIEESSI
jgi:hypothetical protein